MKFLVLGDVHGNIIALEKVLNVYRKEVDKVISHGDVVNYGPWSNECVELLKESGAICLIGNHEEAFIKGVYPGNNDLVKEFFKMTYKGFKHIDVIKEYDYFYEIDDYQIIHTINNEYYYPNTDVSELKLKANTIIGHSHYAFHKTLLTGKTFTNTGSVGQNRKDLSVIDFVILDTERNSVELKSLSYDPLPVLKEMQLKKYPEPCINYYKSKLIQNKHL